MGHAEGEEGQRHRAGKGGQGCSLQWQEGEDSWRSDQGDPGQEQVRKDREQGCVRASEEELGRKRIEEVVRCLQTGAQGVGHQGLLRSRWEDRAGEGSVCQDQGYSRQVKLGGSWSMRVSCRSILLLDLYSGRRCCVRGLSTTTAHRLEGTSVARCTCRDALRALSNESAPGSIHFFKSSISTSSGPWLFLSSHVSVCSEAEEGSKSSWSVVRKQ